MCVPVSKLRRIVAEEEAQTRAEGAIHINFLQTLPDTNEYATPISRITTPLTRTARQCPQRCAYAIFVLLSYELLRSPKSEAELESLLLAFGEARMVSFR